MTHVEILRRTMDNARNVTKMLLADLSDDDLLIRPAPNANHIAWQLGHLIVSEQGLMSTLPHADMPTLPTGFKDNHNEAASKSDDRTRFSTKAVYLDLMEKVRKGTLACLSHIKAEELNQPGPEKYRNFLPTVLDVLTLMSNHEMMHAGQFSVVRRKLGKPNAF